jgi:hypothetical protein
MRQYKSLLNNFIFLSILLISCTTNSATHPNNNPISTLEFITSTPILTSTSTITPTAYITAIPNKELESTNDFEKIINNYLKGKSGCYHSILDFEKERKEAGDPIFIEKETDFGSASIWSSAIAENENLSLKAFIACIPLEINSKACGDSVIIKDSILRKTYEVKFYGQSSNRPTYMIGWIGNEILTFWQNNSPATSTIVAIDIKNRTYAYLALYFYWCE